MTITAVLRSDKQDAPEPVYLRVSHKSKSGYVRTDCYCMPADRRGLKITSRKMQARVSLMVYEAYDRLSTLSIDLSVLSVADIVSLLSSSTQDVSFTDYADTFIRNKRETSDSKQWKNYVTAINNLKTFFRRDRIEFGDLNQKILSDWVKSLSGTKRAKQQYPMLMSTIYKEARRDGIIKDDSPFEFLRIPPADVPAQKAVSANVIRRYAASDGSPAQCYARDVCMLSFCLAGINVGDLYRLKCSDYHDGKIHYCRNKTLGKLRERSYREISIPQNAMPFFDRLRESPKSGFLLNLSARYSSPELCTSFVSRHSKELCAIANLPKMTTYTMRHSWATIAHNEAGVPMSDVAYALGHSSSMSVTSGYILADYRRIDEANKKVLDVVFE